MGDHASPNPRPHFDAERVTEVVRLLEDNVQRLGENLRRLETTREVIRVGRSEREILHDSAYARLQGRLATMPVIEQAKGMIMATKGCDADEAFDVLRRASQRTNVPIRELAAKMVEDAPLHGMSRPRRDPGRPRLQAVPRPPASS